MSVFEIGELEYYDLIRTIYSQYGYDFELYSKASMIRRINRFMINKAIDTISQLKKLVTADREVFEVFVQEMTVNVTEMFRDPSFYKKLRSSVFPYLHTYPNVRIWDAGCSTGEESYSLAILLQEENLLSKTRVYATDINQKVLSIAREGIYPISYMRSYSQNYLKSGGKGSLADYYHAKFNSAIMNHELVKNFLFSVHNLTNDRSFNQFNLIVCRNVLIYFQKDLQERVLKLFAESLPVYGFLALGSKESIRFTSINEDFEVIDAREKIYKKIR